MNRKIVLDIDGVLADFEMEFCKEFGYENRHLTSLEKRYPNKTLGISQFLEDPLTYSNLKPIRLGLQIWEYLYRSNYEISIVTSRPAITEWTSRTWLTRHGIKFDSFYCSPQKTGKIMLIQPFCAVDDLFNVYETLKRHYVPVILISHPWNEYYDKNAPIVDSLDQFIDAFSRIENN